MTREIWKDVVGWKGLYQVSSLGRIKSLDRTVVCSNGRRVHRRGRVLKTPIGNRGYPQCCLVKNRRQKSVSVHKIVARAFHGRCPRGHEVRHDDGVKSNCAASNLVYGTPSENQKDRVRHGTSNRGERGSKAKLTAKDVVAIRNAYANGGVSHSALGAEYGVGRTTIGEIMTGRNWAWL